VLRSVYVENPFAGGKPGLGSLEHADGVVAIYEVDATKLAATLAAFDLTSGSACRDLLAAADPPVALWDERETMLARVTEVLSATAGLAWAADRHTVGLFVNPETVEGGKLAYAFSEISSEGLAGLLNIHVAARSTWVAGHAGDTTLEVFASAAEAATSKAA
jgi:hypothetical protein